MKNLVQMLKDAGASEVHVRISSPPFRHPCYFGTDVPSEEELIANRLSMDGICRLKALPEMVKGLPICSGCFDNHYPMEIPEPKPFPFWCGE